MAQRARVIWAAPALEAVDEIAAWIAVDDPRAAARVVGKVLRGVDRLRSVPRPGRRVPELPGSPYRELVVPPCRIVYRQEGKDVLIVLVVRGEQKLPTSKLK